MIRYYAEKAYSGKEKSYLNWAKQELIDRLLEDEDVPPLLVLEDFEHLMDKFCGYKSDLAFEIALIMTDDIIQMLVG